MQKDVCLYQTNFHWLLHYFIFFIAGAAIDLSSLIVLDGKVCWDLYIDGLVISSDGNLLDTLAAAIKVLLLPGIIINLMSLFFSYNKCNTRRIFD